MNAPASARKTVTELTDPELEELYAALDRATTAAAAIEAACVTHADDPSILTPSAGCAAGCDRALREFGAEVRKALHEMPHPSLGPTPTD